MKTCFCLDLKDDPVLIAEYEAHHRAVWPEVVAHLRSSGITACEIYRAGNRLFMILESSTGAATDSGQLPARVAEWEALMETYQQRLPFAAPNQKWFPLDQIFQL
ncbi:MAG: L-rhamnose mutarotase [Armatimonadetes bacterium]|nr:L-rhamnose mutarotase [Armatimonadota bacterium]